MHLWPDSGQESFLHMNLVKWFKWWQNPKLPSSSRSSDAKTANAAFSGSHSSHQRFLEGREQSAMGLFKSCQRRLENLCVRSCSPTWRIEYGGEGHHWSHPQLRPDHLLPLPFPHPKKSTLAMAVTLPGSPMPSLMGPSTSSMMIPLALKVPYYTFTTLVPAVQTYCQHPGS